MNIIADTPAVRNHNVLWVEWRKTLLLHRLSLGPLWDKYFPAHDLATGRPKRYPLDTFERACDLAEAEATKRPVDAKLPRLRRLLDEDVSLDRAWQQINRPESRPTPQVTVEAIWHSIRERGLNALDEPINRQRLSECDSAGRAELQRRLDG